MNRLFLPLIILTLFLSFNTNANSYSKLDDSQIQQKQINNNEEELLDLEILELFDTISLRGMSIELFEQKQLFKDSSVDMSLEELRELRDSLSSKLVEINDIR